MYLYVSIHLSIYIITYTYTYTYIYIYIYIYKYVYVCIHKCHRYLYLYVCQILYKYIYLYIQLCKYIYVILAIYIHVFLSSLFAIHERLLVMSDISELPFTDMYQSHISIAIYSCMDIWQYIHTDKCQYIHYIHSHHAGGRAAATAISPVDILKSQLLHDFRY